MLSTITINPTISTNGNSSNNIAFALDPSDTEPFINNKETSTNIGDNTNSLDGTSSSVGNSNSNNDNNADSNNVSNGDDVANSTSNVDITNVEGEGEGEGDGDGDGDAGISPLADLTSDGVTLVWNSSDDPIQSTYGDSSTVLYRYNRFNVTADNIKQYQILANVVDNANGSNGNKLIGYTSTDSTIQNGSSIDAISNSNGIVGKDLTSTTTSQWGYTIADGEVTNETNLANLTYKAVPAASSSTSGKTEAVTSLNNRAFTIAFAANIADDKPAGSYRTNVEVSVVVEPGKLTEFPISNMQDMTSSICDSVEVGTTKQLKDTRDQKYYWVTKIQNSANKNETCWMTQNLDYDGGGTRVTQLAEKPWLQTSDFTSSDSSGKYYDPGVQYCPNGSCETTSSLSSNGGHDARGNYYNWFAAVNNTGTPSTPSGTTAPGSICPENWQLPNYAEDDKAKNCAFLLEGITDVSTLMADPYYFTLSGTIANGSFGNIQSGSLGSYYFSSTKASSIYAYVLNVHEKYPVGFGESIAGFAGIVRCIAK